MIDLNETKIKIKILIVEDSEDDAELVILELKRGGFDPKWNRVQNAEEMKTALREHSWDIIISDYQMPEFNGLDALALTRNFDHDIPFILVSGKIGEEIAVKIMKEGAQDFVNKDNLARLVPVFDRELNEANMRRNKKKAEEALRHSEERFRELANLLPQTIFEIDLKGNIIYSNESGFQITGYSQGDIDNGLNTMDLFIPRDRIRLKKMTVGRSSLTMIFSFPKERQVKSPAAGRRKMARMPTCSEPRARHGAMMRRPMSPLITNARLRSIHFLTSFSRNRVLHVVRRYKSKTKLFRNSINSSFSC